MTVDLARQSGFSVNVYTGDPRSIDTPSGRMTLVQMT